MFPVESALGEIRRHLAANRDVVLTAPPGSGKTTVVPRALLDEPWLAGKKIIMLEPRRLAARNSALYIARSMGESVGGTVGYQVRLERRISSSTRLEILTEGLLSQRLLADPELTGTGLVIFDEFHERSLACDLAFALSLEVKRALREDLRLMVMSATLDAGEVALHMGGAAEVSAQGRMFPVETRYLGDVSMTAAVSRALKETEGDILCFLPGEGEIRRTCEALEGTAAEILPLYGSLPKEEQDRVFAPAARRKVVLATSIAETSLTIEGITCVIDSGLMRTARFSPATGMSALVTSPLTADRAEQRRGRAGRVAPGICYRLWSEGEQALRPKKMTPEILDADLASLALTCMTWGAAGREDLPWMTPPAASAWEQAKGLLRLLGALDASGFLTDKGRKMASMPMHPRLANMLLAGGDPVLAAIVEEGGRSRETDIRYVTVSGRVKELARRFAGFCRRREGAPSMSPGAMLAMAYPERIARNRGNGTFRMVSGRGAALERDDPLSAEPYIVACKLDERSGDARVFLAAPIAEAEIVDLFGNEITETRCCEWDRRTDSVKNVLRGALGEMVIYEKPSRSAEGAEKAVLDGVRAKGVANLPCWSEGALQMKARIDFLHRRMGEEAGWPAIDDETVIAGMEGFVAGVMKWRDLEKIDMIAVLDSVLAAAGHDRRELDRLAPSRMEVPSGSRMTIDYGGDEPTLSARLQECFGLMQTPTVAQGRVPVVMTLLSPAGRPIQVTKDLAGFWKGAYQLVRKDMRGRYPRHYWPEDPFTAVATRRVRPPPV